jgi:hypothetical protein
MIPTQDEISLILHCFSEEMRLIILNSKYYDEIDNKRNSTITAYASMLYEKFRVLP